MNDGIRIGVIYARSPDKAERRLRKLAAKSITDIFQTLGYAAVIKELPAGTAQTGIGGVAEADVLVPAGTHSKQELRRLAAYAEALGIAAAGLEPMGAVLGADRVLLRRLLAGERVPQSLFRTFTRSQWEQDSAYFLIEMELTLGYPCRIGPADSGCGQETVLAASREELQAAVEGVFRRTDRVLAEEMVQGRVYTAAMGGGEDPGDIAVMELGAVLPPSDTGARTSAGKQLETEVRNASRRAFAALQAKGAALLYFVTPDGQSNVLWTDADLCPELGTEGIHAAVWRNAGTADGDRLRRIVRTAWEQPGPGNCQ
ncbi:MAG: D-alanine--D-alanine ligase [Paenibacillaceae bacterium]|nr:D-alanine--D-alanine ligase [Paenibacillaceae bacterium]